MRFSLSSFILPLWAANAALAYGVLPDSGCRGSELLSQEFVMAKNGHAVEVATYSCPDHPQYLHQNPFSQPQAQACMPPCSKEQCKDYSDPSFFWNNCTDLTQALVSLPWGPLEIGARQISQAGLGNCRYRITNLGTKATHYCWKEIAQSANEIALKCRFPNDPGPETGITTGGSCHMSQDGRDFTLEVGWF
ncbi:hypothetical protein SISSUDRAFT_1064068 [Sistotremastrum suecicum HHB10207 ss-3]|uniref:Uncharacterized protein n=1 Tax=Sistotremastrum suecicum HHB10207 ss-3 TaxID=1314776 RepID=A0A166B2S9_9AGAM|nr:hypothetical protein SISSUDRAFT_1064068 [Sistotremastrum suecicum HHB10207 ss-3]